MRPTRLAAFAVLAGSLASVGCLSSTGQEKEPLVLGQDTRSVLSATGAGNSNAKAAKPATFDPTATGGSGITVPNSFNRTTPGAGTGSSTGNFASSLPPPQVGLPPPVSPPAIQGASYGDPMPDSGRSSLPPGAVSRALPPQPAASSPFGPNPPKLDPPLHETPSAQPKLSPPPDLSGPIRPVMPDLDRGSTPAPAMPASAIPAPVMPDLDRGTTSSPVVPVSMSVPGGPIPPIPTAAPGSTTNEPLPAIPAPPVYVQSPTEAPIPGVQSLPKLPPAPPIRPQ